MMPTRWRVFAILGLIFMMSVFFRVSMAVSAKDLAGDLHLGADQLGVLSGIFFYAFALAQIPLGPLLDRFGGRKMISLTGVITTLGAVVFASAPSYPVAIIGRTLLGIGTACVLMGSLKIYTNWFTVQEFPAVSGFMIAAGNLGNMLATAPLAYAVTSFGWRLTFFAFSFLQAGAALTVYLVARDAPAWPDSPLPAAAPADGEIVSQLAAWRTLFRTPTFWLICLLAFFWYGNYMVLQSLWGGPYLMEAVGMSRVQAGQTLMFTSLGLVLGSLVLGKTIDRMAGSLKKTIMAGQAVILLAMTVMLGPAEQLPRPLLSAVFFLIGLASGTAVIIYPLVRTLVPHQFAATAMTGVNLFLLLGAAVVQHIMGIYIASFPKGPLGYPAGAYHGAFLIPICGLAVALGLFSFAAERTDSPSTVPQA